VIPGPYTFVLLAMGALGLAAIAQRKTVLDGRLFEAGSNSGDGPNRAASELG
jgi:hypothetical protein